MGQHSPEDIPAINVLEDEVIELRLLRVLGCKDSALRSPESQFLCRSPEHRFAIHRRSDGLRVGRIHLRVTNDETIVSAVGHIGYEVNALYRRNGYAVRAIRLIIGLAHQYGIAPLWVLLEPENVASRKVVEQAGFQLVDVVNTQPKAAVLGIGSQVCRYVVEQP